ncbi:MAG TPA: S1 RNA-binding domain-containing protein [Terriglobia bacterium]|nr:S1 RNA-binding domain-containing protein [Terriglobia bacterium]
MEKDHSQNNRNEPANEEDFATLLARYEESKQQIKTGQLVEGRIVSIFDTDVLVDAGGRSEGILKREEITGPDGVLLFNVGDIIPVMVENGAGPDQQLRLSYTKASRLKKQAVLHEAIRSGKLLQGKVVEVVKGGLLVDVGMRGFIPASQIDEQYVEDLKIYVGQTLTLKVMQHDLPQGKLILSRKAILKEAAAERRRETLANLVERQRRLGVIKRVLDYGVFVDIGGIEGLLHISEMSWRRIKHPSELFQVGDEIEVEILKYDREKNRISLGFRKPEDDPWLHAGEFYSEGTVVPGVITKLEHYGAFAELPSGLQGLIPVSEMSWTRRVTHPEQLLKVGDQVEAVVTRLDVMNRKMSLSLRQITEHPWDVFSREHQAGQVLVGKVTRTADFGIFVELIEGVEGLVHFSELSEAPSKALLGSFKPGQEIQVKILGIDLANKKISLSVKAIHEAEAQQSVQEYLEGESDAGSHTLGESFPEELRQFTKKAE